MKKKKQELMKLLRKCDLNLKKLAEKERKARLVWTKGYHNFLKAAKHLALIKIRGTKIEQKLKDIIGEWDEKTVLLTRERDEARRKLEEEKEKKKSYEIELAAIIEKDRAEIREIDEIVDQVFKLNEAVVAALEQRNSYLGRHVYGLLLDEKGNLRSQISFTSSDGLKKIVALVNTISKILPEFAGRAKEEIERFFSRFQKEQMDEPTKALYELTRKLLVEKTAFKIGPDLYRFLSLELDRELFPELKSAQDFLKKSLRSEKTESYVRLYKRESKTEKWQPDRQI